MLHRDAPPLHVLTPLCRNTWVAIALNVATVVVTVAFATSIHLLGVHQRAVEKAAGMKNPYDGFMTFTFWSSIVFAIVLAGVVVYQVIHRLRTSKK